MRLPLLATTLTAAFLASGRIDAATIQISSNLDGVWSESVEAPYVGTITITYDGSGPLTNGSYALTSLSNYQVSIVFPNVPGVGQIAFDQSHLDVNPAGIFIQVINGSFFFTNSATNGRTTSLGNGRSPVDSPLIASAVFDNGVYSFGAEFINSTLLTGGWSGGANKQYNAKYEMGGRSPSDQIIGVNGDYGTSTPVPEPSTYGLILGGLALAGAAVRRRKISK